MCPLFLASCENANTIVVPNPPPGTVDGVTAYFDSLEVTLQKTNPSWYPKDNGISPDADEVFVTLAFRIHNAASSTRQLHVSDFRLRTISYNPANEVHTWQALTDGRKPSLTIDTTLTPGQEIEAWVTFRVPKNSLPNVITSEVLDAVIWSPTPSTVLAIPLPNATSERIFEVLFFGKILDNTETPIPGAMVNITPINPYLGIPEAHDRCIGSPEPTQHYVTNDEGEYSGVFRLGPTPFELCINALVLSPADAESQADSSGTWVKLGVESSTFERPELRIDLALPAPHQ